MAYILDEAEYQHNALRRLIEDEDLSRFDAFVEYEDGSTGYLRFKDIFRRHRAAPKKPLFGINRGRQEEWEKSKHNPHNMKTVTFLVDGEFIEFAKSIW